MPFTATRLSLEVCPEIIATAFLGTSKVRASKCTSFLVGGAVYWRSGEAHTQNTVLLANNLTAGSTRHNSNEKYKPVVLLRVIDHLTYATKAIGQPRRSVPAIAA